jgi:hypothetical protein
MIHISFVNVNKAMLHAKYLCFRHCSFTHCNINVYPIQVYMYQVIHGAVTILILGSPNLYSAHRIVLGNIPAKSFHFFLLVQKIQSGHNILKLIQMT